MLFALVCFREDKNISDRSYWYRASFPLAAGEEVLCPVGSHDRLQLGVVEQVLETDPDHAPYDLRFIKEIAQKKGARWVRRESLIFKDLGGVRYDEKHFTQPYRLYCGRADVLSEEDKTFLSECGIERVLSCTPPQKKFSEELEREEFFDTLRKLAADEKPTLLLEGDVVGAALLALVGTAKGTLEREFPRIRFDKIPDMEFFLDDIGISREEICLLKERLTVRAANRRTDAERKI